MIINTHVSKTVFQENTYILIKNNEVLIIDPGDKIENILPYIDSKDKVLAVLATHGHLDHISSVSDLCKKYSCPFVMSSRDQDVLDNHKNSCDMFKQEYYGTPKINIDISNENELHLSTYDIKIFHTPGHTKGGVSFLIDNVLFSGDTLFRHSIGHVNQYGGNPETLLNSIKKVLFPLPDETIVYPGHLGTTTIGEEKKHNPYLIL
jgi:glyoxylase-like metal-dependent hydrolase (beta-lactamase superfamily II)